MASSSQFIQPQRLSTPTIAVLPVTGSLLPGFSVYGYNMYNPHPTPLPTTGLRPVIIDGSNVAYGHGFKKFSSRGIQICIDYFLARSHEVTAFVPLSRLTDPSTLDPNILLQLENERTLIFTPSRCIEGRIVSPYDDRYILQVAADEGGVIVSKDNYRDLVAEEPLFAETVNNRLLMHTWYNDILIFPEDPMGPEGTSLDNLLKF